MFARTASLVGLILALGTNAHAAPVPAGDPATAFKPTVTARLAPLDQVLGDIRYTAELIARFAPFEKEAKEFVGATDELLNKSLGPDWRKAVDTSRPLLAYVTLNVIVPASTGATLIPVKDEAAFRKMVAALVGRVEDGPGGVLRFEVPGDRDADGKPINGYLRFANQYAYLTYKTPETVALNRIPTPAQIVASDPAAALSARLFLDRVPDLFRQQAIVNVQQTKAMISGNMGGGPGMYFALMPMLTFGTPMFQLYPLAEPAVRDGQELTVDVRYDRKRLNLNLEATLTAKAGSEMSKLTAALKPAISLFPQMLGPDLAARGLIRGTIPEDIRKAVVPQIEAGLGQAAQADAVWGAFVSKIGESLLPTLREGEIDLAGGLFGPGKDERYGVVAGLRLKDAASVEKALREAVGALPKNDQALFKLDTATVAGLKVHHLPPLPEPLRPFFGEPTIHIAFGADRVVIAFGDEALRLLEKGQSAKPQPISQSVIEVSGRKLVPLVTKIDAEAGRKFKAFLGTDLDRIPIMEMAVEGGSTLKVKYGNGLATFFPAAGLFAWRMVAAAEMRQAQPAQVAPAPPAKP